MGNSIAIVVCAWPPQGGGMGNNGYYHAKNLAALNYSIEVFTPRYRSAKENQENFKVNYLPMWPRFGLAGFLFVLLGRLKNFDIIHFYYPFFGTDLIIWLFKFFHQDKKLILHYQMDPIGRGWQKIIFSWHIKLFLGPIVRASNKIIVLSFDHGENSYLAKYIKKWPDKFVAIPNGIDEDIFRPQTKDDGLRQKYNISQDDKVIIFVGGLDKQHYFKGVEILLKAVQDIRGNIKIKLLLVGEGDLKEHYKKLALDLGINENVIFTGWIDNTDLPKYYSLADVFVLPSTASTESFGIVIAEAQACGLPAVVSNWPGSRETLKDGETGLLIKPGDVNDLSEKLIRLLTDDELKKQLGESAQIRARELYGWQKIIQQIDSLYKGL
ncbi:glycosyltransferase family 4 protein [Candidatus Falkowbacteria bacterium]|nr:glycosyltransferase family 4 protein [Candidatus Falkowbacteria bacterium]